MPCMRLRGGARRTSRMHPRVRDCGETSSPPEHAPAHTGAPTLTSRPAGTPLRMRGNTMALSTSATISPLNLKLVGGWVCATERALLRAPRARVPD